MKKLAFMLVIFLVDFINACKPEKLDLNWEEHPICVLAHQYDNGNPYAAHIRVDATNYLPVGATAGAFSICHYLGVTRTEPVNDFDLTFVNKDISAPSSEIQLKPQWAFYTPIIETLSWRNQLPAQADCWSNVEVWTRVIKSNGTSEDIKHYGATKVNFHTMAVGGIYYVSGNTHGLGVATGNGDVVIYRVKYLAGSLSGKNRTGIIILTKNAPKSISNGFPELKEMEPFKSSTMLKNILGL